MSLDTLFIIACVLLYLACAWRFYIGLDIVLPAPKWVNILTSILWPGFIVGVLALIVLVVIVGCVFAVGFAGLLSYDILKTLFTGKPIQIKDDGLVEGDEIEEEDE